MESASDPAIDRVEELPPEPETDEIEAEALPLAPRLRGPRPLEPLPNLPLPTEPARASLPPAPLTAPLPRSLAFTSSLTLNEFLAREEADAALTRRRVTEVRLPPGDQLFFAEYPDTLNLIAVVDLALPETATILPLWARIAVACPRADLRVISDDDLSCLRRLLGDDTQPDLDALELPMLFVFDEELLLQAQWGPRPQAAEPYLDDWLALHPEFESLADSDTVEAQQALAAQTQDLAYQMRIWYNSGLDAEASAELRALLASLRDDAGDGQ